MAQNQVKITVTEITVTTGKQKEIMVYVDGKKVFIPVDESVYAYFKDQFLRKNPTTMQKHRFITIMSVIRAAYLKGISDGKN